MNEEIRNKIETLLDQHRIMTIATRDGPDTSPTSTPLEPPRTIFSLPAPALQFRIYALTATAR